MHAEQGQGTRGPSRREFARTTLSSGFAAAVLPVQAQTTITTDSDGLAAGEVEIAVGDGTMPAYRAFPAGLRKAPIILVVQEIFGVHEHIKDVCRRFAKLGYFAVAPELYAQEGRREQDQRHPYACLPDCFQGARCPGHERSGRERLLGSKKRRRWRQAGRNWILLGGTHSLAVRRAQPESEGGSSLVRAAGGRVHRAHAIASGRPCRSGARAGTRTLRRGRQRHPGRVHRADEAGAGRQHCGGSPGLSSSFTPTRPTPSTPTTGPTTASKRRRTGGNAAWHG